MSARYQQQQQQQQQRSRGRLRNGGTNGSAANNAATSKSSSKSPLPVSATVLSAASTTAPISSGSNVSASTGVANSNSFDKLKQAVLEEGTNARNLLKFNVPVEDATAVAAAAAASCSATAASVGTTTASSKPSSRRASTTATVSHQHPAGGASSRKKSSTPVRAPDLRERYWALLLENLKRTIDEIYSNCEADQSEAECREVHIILEHCCRDFAALIEKIRLFREDGAADRPGGAPIAWVERKTSPCKPIMKQVLERSLNAGSSRVRSPVTAGGCNLSCGSGSWADKVRASLLEQETVAAAAAVAAAASAAGTTTGPATTVVAAEPTASPSTLNLDASSIAPASEDAAFASAAAAAAAASIAPAAVSDSLVSGEAIGPVDSGWAVVLRRNRRGVVKALYSVADSLAVSAGCDKADKAPVASETSRDTDDKLTDIERHQSEEPQAEARKDFASETATSASVSASPETNPGALDAEPATCSASEIDDESTGDIEQLERQLDAMERDQAELETALSHEELHNLVDYTRPMTWDELVAQNTRLQQTTVPWELMAALQEEEDADDETFGERARTPGRSAHIHDKLSAWRRGDADADKLAEKQVKARETRERLFEERVERVRDLTKRIDEVKRERHRLLEERRCLLELRMSRAEAKRQAALEEKIRKAHDEETKGREIQFIQSLGAEQRQADIAAKHAESEQRLAEQEKLRRRRSEINAEREAAAEIRRRNIEEIRLARLASQQERRACKEREIAEKREAAAAERARSRTEREEKRQQLHSQLEEEHMRSITQLKDRIERRQADTQRRHAEQLKGISRRAFDLSILRHSSARDESPSAPPARPYPRAQYCSACRVLIRSEVELKAHLRSRSHLSGLREAEADTDADAYNLAHIVDAPAPESGAGVGTNASYAKALRKRARKLRQKFSNKAREFQQQLQAFDSGSPSTTAVPKWLREIKRLLTLSNVSSSGTNGNCSAAAAASWVPTRSTALDRALNEGLRFASQQFYQEQQQQQQEEQVMPWSEVEGTATLAQLLEQRLPDRSLALCQQLLCIQIARSAKCAKYLLMSGRAPALLDLLGRLPDNLVPVLTQLFHQLPRASLSEKPTVGGLGAQDLLAYLLCSGAMDSLAGLLQAASGAKPHSPQQLSGALGLMRALLEAGLHEMELLTQLTQALIPLLYSLLLQPPAGSSPDWSLVGPAMRLLRSLLLAGGKNLVVDCCLSDDVLSLELRHIAACVLRSPEACPQPDYLLHPLLDCLAIVASLGGPDGQTCAQSGPSPTVLQLLAKLPFRYFTEPSLRTVLFPAVLACTINNLAHLRILAQDLSPRMVIAFLDSLPNSTADSATVSSGIASESARVLDLVVPKAIFNEIRAYYADFLLQQSSAPVSTPASSVAVPVV